MRTFKPECNAVISAFLRQHPSPSVLSLEPKCALDKFNICGNAWVEVQRPVSWMGSQKLGNTEMLLILYTGGENKAEPKPICGNPYVALQSKTPLQKSLLSSFYVRVSPQNQASLNFSKGEIIHFPQNLLVRIAVLSKAPSSAHSSSFSCCSSKQTKTQTFFILMILLQISVR